MSSDEQQAEPLGTWQAEPNGLTEGDGMFIYTGNDRTQRVTVVTYFGELDGKPVLEVEGTADLRINVNDSTIYNRHTEEVSQADLAALAWYKQMTGQPAPYRLNSAKLRAELVDLGFTNPDAGMVQDAETTGPTDAEIVSRLRTLVNDLERRDTREEYRIRRQLRNILEGES